MGRVLGVSRALCTLPASNAGEYGQVANTSGFSLHAGVFANADEPEKLERLCRYISRPAISEQRLSITDQGKVRYELKTPYRDGTTHVFFYPIDFIGKLWTKQYSSQSGIKKLAKKKKMNVNSFRDSEPLLFLLLPRQSSEVF